MIQEFDISITHFGDDKYLVRTENVAPGVPLAQEQVQWPVEDWVRQANVLMHDPLLGLLKGQTNQRWSQDIRYRSGSNPEGQPETDVPSLVGLGQDLYNKLFFGLLRDSWLTAQGIAQNRRHVLRLRLGIKDSSLQKLPWEALHAGDRPLATGTDVTFSRYLPDLRHSREQLSPSVADFSKPLRILMVIAAPNDQDRLELKREVHHLQSELHPAGYRLGGNGDNGLLEETSPQTLDIQLNILEQPGRAELTQALEQGNFQILHYAGHSNLGNAGGDLYLVSRQTGLTERLSGEDLAGLLVNNGIKLAVFNSCRGAYSSVSDAEKGWKEQNLAQALVNRGVPGVIAMAERIPDDVAIQFTRLLYRNLRQGKPIDLCLNRTRQGLISSYGSHHYYWALPILYLQPSFDGYLFSQSSTAEETLDHFLFAQPRPVGGTALDELEKLTRAKADSPVAQSSVAQSAQQPVVVPSPPEPPLVHDSEAPSLIDDADLDDLVETLEYEELLSYNDDTTAMADLVEQLSQPPLQDDLMLADDAESLLPEPLETPGLSIYEDLPENPEDELVLGQGANPAPAVEKTQPGPGPKEEPLPIGAGLQLTAVSGWQRWRRRYGKQTLFAALAGAVLVTAVGVSVADPFNWFTADSRRALPEIDRTDIEQLDPSGQAILALNQRDLGEAAQLLGVLIVQDHQKEALEIMNSSNASVLADPQIAFLRGRAQWELFRQNNEDYDADDARRSWEQAVEAEPTWVDAQIALGFAYYAEENWDAAITAWSDAIIYSERSQSFRSAVSEAGLEVVSETVPNYLSAYAGLAMVYYKQAQIDVDPTETDYLMRQAASYQLKVLLQGGTAFQPQQLGNNWIWVESAIADWRATQLGLAEYLEQNT